MKHMMKFKKQAAFGTLVAAALMFVGFNCTRLESNKYLQGSQSISGSSTQTGPTVPIGLVSSEQALKTMIAVSGVEGLGELTDPADANISSTYDARSGSLPSSQDISQATAPTLISATNLAGTVCAKLVDRERGIGEAQRGTRLFFREMDFTMGLAQQNSTSVTAAFQRLARNAWRRDVSSDELQSLVTFAQEFSAGADTTDPAQTRLLAISLCTVALSSIEALTY